MIGDKFAYFLIGQYIALAFTYAYFDGAYAKSLYWVGAIVISIATILMK